MGPTSFVCYMMGTNSVQRKLQLGILDAPEGVGEGRIGRRSASRSTSQTTDAQAPWMKAEADLS